jgi:hypothetical protein
MQIRTMAHFGMKGIPLWRQGDGMVYRSHKLWCKRTNQGLTSASQNLVGMCLLRQQHRVSNTTARLAHQLMLSAQDVRYGMAG